MHKFIYTYNTYAYMCMYNQEEPAALDNRIA